MNYFGLLQSEFLKTKRCAVRRVALASPLCLSVLALVQGRYFSLNLFNWFYVMFLPVTLSLISAAAVNIDHGKMGLRAIRALSVKQRNIWIAKLLIVAGYALFSCLLLSAASIVVPAILGLLGIHQIKVFRVSESMAGVFVMFLTSIWQVPLSFILAKKGGLIFTVSTNLFLSFSGVLLALKSYWFFCPWAWVNRCMISVLGVLPNGLPNENNFRTGIYDVVLSLVMSLGVAVILGCWSTFSFAKSEAR